ncbi:MAG: hypothetical protein KDB01_24385 [Planctomycetaceae bacterium]|nr:hypothetical protein [Planctomycetaceae bacterium]
MPGPFSVVQSGILDQTLQRLGIPHSAACAAEGRAIPGSAHKQRGEALCVVFSAALRMCLLPSPVEKLADRPDEGGLVVIVVLKNTSLRWHPGGAK